MILTEEKQALLVFLNQHVALLTLIGFCVIVVWALKLVLYKMGVLKKYASIVTHFTKYVSLAGFLITLLAMVGSLFYSYYLGVAACDLCWLGRIFMYPLVFIFGLALIRGEDIIASGLYRHILTLSGIGLLISLYHHYLQMGYSLLAPCSTAPFAVDCATPTFIEYGFITFPFMGVVTCSLVILLVLTAKVMHKEGRS